MRNDYDSFTLAKISDSLVNFYLIFRICCRCRLIENKYRRIFQDCTRYCNALLFAARKTCSETTRLFVS